jgi:hypothetical protein
MREVEKWVLGKPVLVAQIAQSLALKSEAYSDLLESFSYLADRTYFNEFTNLSGWLTLYKNNKHLFRELILVFRSFGGFSKELADIYDFFMTSLKNKKSTNQIGNISEESNIISDVFTQVSSDIELNPQVKEELERIKKIHEEDLKNDLLGILLDEQLENVGKALQKPEFLFLLKVLGPCISLYMDHPTRLYRKARLGDIDSWDKLIRIDKFLLCDPRISWHLVKAYEKNDFANLNRMVKAIEGGPPKKDFQYSKLFTAGLISIMSELLGYRLSSSKIRELFNAVAVDSGTYNQTDEDLPASHEAFTKGIEQVRYLFNLTPR